MFERFARTAREAVIQAQVEARELGDPTIGPEHVLLGALWNADGPAAEALRNCGISYRAARQVIESGTGGRADADALAEIGIDLDEVRRRVEATFGEGALDRRRRSKRTHLPFGKDAKKALELALREAISLKSTEIGVEHLLLALTRVRDTAASDVIKQIGADPDRLHDQLRRRLQQAA